MTMFSLKKFFVSTLVLTSLVTVTTVPAFAATEKPSAPNGGPRIVHHVHTIQPTSTSPIVLKKKNDTTSGGITPNLSSTTTDGNGGSATITLMESDTSFAWSIVPSWFGPYTYSVYVVIEKQSGAYVNQSSFKGLSIGGTHSDVTGSYGYLPVGSYYAILEGTCIYDFGEAVIKNPTIPFYID